MGQTESNLGIIPGYGGTQRLPRLIGRTKALESPMARSIDVEIDAFMPTLRSEDAAEGIQAFFAKREPEFKGR